MPAEATCPHCQLTLRIPSDYAGRSVKCPQCQQRFIVSMPGQAAVAVSQTPLPRPVVKSSGEFDDLIMSVLDADDEEDEGEAYVTKAAGPSLHWRCPRCTALWEKKPLPTAAIQSTHIEPMVRCETCGAAYAYAAVQSGKYDAPEVTVTCAHCGRHLKGPAEGLLGQPCPGCTHRLPRQ